VFLVAQQILKDKKMVVNLINKVVSVGLKRGIGTKSKPSSLTKIASPQKFKGAFFTIFSKTNYQQFSWYYHIILQARRMPVL